MKLNFFRLEPLNSAMEQPMEQLGTLWRVVCKITITFGTELWKSLWNCPVASFHPALNCHSFGTTIGTHFCNLWAKLIVEWKDLLRMKLWSQLKAHQWRYVTLHTLCTKEIFIEPHVAIAKARNMLCDVFLCKHRRLRIMKKHFPIWHLVFLLYTHVSLLTNNRKDYRKKYQQKGLIFDTWNPGTVFENHRKSLIQHFERSELRLHFEWTKVNFEWSWAHLSEAKMSEAKRVIPKQA